MMAYKKPSPVLIDSRLGHLKDALKRSLGLTVYRNCLNCSEWNEKDETCKRFNSRPPAEIIVYSCEQWEEGKDWDIPF